MSDVSQTFEGSKLVAKLDSDGDGVASVQVELNMSEALAELISKGQAKEGVKVVDFSFDVTGLTLKVDTDKDGEDLLLVKIAFSESVDEISKKIKGE